MPANQEPMQSLSALDRLEGIFLESVLPVRAFATLTTAHLHSEWRICSAYSGWIRGVQSFEHLTLGWIRGIELHPQRHIHAALVAARELDCEYAERLWQRMVAPRYDGAALVEPYRRGLCGLGYILKQLPEVDDGIQLSSNLPAFAQSGGKTMFRDTPAQRRQYRRIQEQIQANR